MSARTVDSPQQLTDALGVQPLGSLSPNIRVRGSFGFVATQADFVIFPAAPNVFATWLSGTKRTRANGLPMINSTSQGVTYVPVPGTPPFSPSGPVLIPAANPRVRTS